MRRNLVLPAVVAVPVQLICQQDVFEVRSHEQGDDGESRRDEAPSVRTCRADTVSPIGLNPNDGAEEAVLALVTTAPPPMASPPST